MRLIYDSNVMVRCVNQRLVHMGVARQRVRAGSPVRI